MRGTDEPYQEWEKRPSFETKDERRVYPLYAPARGSQPHHVWVFDIDVDPLDPDLEYSLKERHRVGFLDWSRGRVDYVETGRARPKAGEASWGYQGIATEMLRLAREMSPDLLHALCRDRVSDAGEAFVRATNPEQACNNNCGEGCRRRGPQDTTESTVSRDPWSRIKGVLGSLWRAGKPDA